MKILHILRRFSFEEWGGTENVVWNYSLTLAKKGIQSDIVTTQALSSISEEYRDDIKIMRLPYIYPNFPMTAKRKAILDKKGGNPIVFGLKKIIKAKSYDCIHLHTAGRFGARVVKLANKYNIPYVMSFHGGYYDVPINELNEMLLPLKHTFPYGGILDRIFKWRTDLLNRAAALICVGENEVANMQQKYPQKKVSYLPNSVDFELFNTQVINYDIKKEFNIPADRFLILNISRIDYQKNQLLLLELLREQKDCHLLLIGPVTSASYYEKIKSKIKEYKLDNQVTIIPGATPASPLMIDAYQSCDCFILPSLHEPFGIVVLEAWASAVAPVLASRVGGLNYLVKDKLNGLKFDSNNLQSLKEAFEKLNNKKLCQKLIQNGKNEAENIYSHDAIVNKLIGIYKSVQR